MAGKSDIELLFGVAGGGSVSGASGAQIKADLDAIVNAINANPYKIKVELDQSSVATFKSQLLDLTTYAQDQARAIKDAYNGITFPDPPKYTGTKGKKTSLIEADSTEAIKAIATIHNYRLKIDKLLKSSSAAKTGQGAQTYSELQKINKLLVSYEGLIKSGSVASYAFADDMAYVAASISKASSEFELLGENINNSLIQKNSVDQFEGLAEVQKYQAQIKKMREEWTAAFASGSKSSGAVQNLTAEENALKTLEQGLRNGTIGANELAKALEHTKAVIKQTTAEVKLHGEDRSLIDFKVGSEENIKALTKVDKLLTQTKKNYQSWTAAAKGATEQDYSGLKSSITILEELHKQLAEGKISFEDYKKNFADVSGNIVKYSTNIRTAGKDTKSFGDSVKDLFNKFSRWLSVSQIVMKTIQTFKQMGQIVIEIDSAMTELRKVTDETEVAYDTFLSNAVVRAKELGATLTDVVSASADFAKLGKSIQEASELADAAIVYKNVGDDIDSIGTAAESIISTMQAFSKEGHTAMEIVDRYNIVGNNFAITSTGVGDALQRSAAAMNAAGNSLDETIALIAASNTIVQNPDSVGTTLKTLSMYLRAAKTEAEEAGESTEGMANSMSELRNEILKLTGNKVDIQIDENNFKSTYQILKELSAEWKNLTDISKANILEMIGGKRNANVVSALLENFDIAEAALTKSANSAGSALAENEKYLDSIQGKIQQFQASWQALSNSVVNSDFLKLAVNGVRLLIDGITWLTDTFGGLGLAISAAPLAVFVSKLKPVAETLKIVEDAAKSFVGGEK